MPTDTAVQHPTKFPSRSPSLGNDRRWSTTLIRTGAVGVAGYLLGTFPSADLVGRLAGVQIRKDGTGNPGTLNTAVVAGKRWAAAVAVLDIGKGWGAVSLGRRVSPTAANVAGFAAVVGHIFPVWTRGKGGKGVATAYGAVLGTFPAYALPDLAIAAGAAHVTANSAQANEIASVAWVGAALLWWRRGWPNLWGPEPTVALPATAILTSILLAWRLRQTDRVADGQRWQRGR
jgi:glycerol-3-phosphate acyltransferase PlsY